MKIKIIERQPVTVAYLRHIGPYGQAIFEFWQNTVYPWMRANDLLGHARYGVCHDDPGITAPDKCRYDACAEVPRNFVPKGDAHLTTIPGGKYAVTEFRGTIADIEEAWVAMLRNARLSNDVQPRARPYYEYYPTDASYDAKTGRFDCQLMIPVMSS